MLRWPAHLSKFLNINGAEILSSVFKKLENLHHYTQIMNFILNNIKIQWCVIPSPELALEISSILRMPSRLRISPSNVTVTMCPSHQSASRYANKSTYTVYSSSWQSSSPTPTHVFTFAYASPETLKWTWHHRFKTNSSIMFLELPLKFVCRLNKILPRTMSQ